METIYDVLIIGSGPGGYVAAIRAAQLGLKTAIVEREHLGGICLNWGCIPTKALLRSAEVHHLAAAAQKYWFAANTQLDFKIQDIVGRSRKVSGELNKGVAFLLKKNKVDVIWGEALIAKAPDPASATPGEVTVSAPTRQAVEPQHAVPAGAKGAGTYGAHHIIIATGARPRTLPGIAPDGQNIWTYFEAMKPAEMPKSLIVIGSGAIGIEFASFYRTLGAEVTVVEALPRILPAEDAEISQLAHKAFEKQGIKIITGAQVSNVASYSDGVSVSYARGDAPLETLRADKLILAVGVVANVENIGLVALGVAMPKGVVATDGFGRTSVPGIYAIGDVAGPPMLAHKAEHEGVICVETIKGLDTHALERHLIPGCTYCNPQIASIGLTEAAAREKGIDIRIGRFSNRGNGKSIALGEPDGLVKTIFDAATGKLLGAHLIGAEVTELIHSFAMALKMGARDQDLIHTVFPHPTLSEMIHESALSSEGRAIHM